MGNFFIWCAGASPQLLSECSEIDKIKQKILGTFVFLTGLIAGLGAFYAFFSTSHDYGISICGSLIWAALIFTLDRLIVSSLYPVKRGDTYSLVLWQGLPRMALAILVGVTIAKPVELYIFREEILGFTREKNEIKFKVLSNSDSSWYDDRLKKIDLRCEEKIGKSDLEWLQTRIKDLSNNITATMNGMNGARKGCGPTCDEFKAQLASAKEEFEKKKELLAGCKKEEKEKLDESKNEKDNYIEGLRTEANNAAATPSFLSQHRVLQEMSGKDSDVWRTSIFISLLFVFFELVPVLAKLMAGVSSYELAVLRNRSEAVEKTDEQILRMQALRNLRKAEEERDAAILQEENEKAKIMHKSMNAHLEVGVLDRFKHCFSAIDSVKENAAPMSELEEMLVKIVRLKLSRLVLLWPYARDAVFSHSATGANEYQAQNYSRQQQDTLKFSPDKDVGEFRRAPDSSDPGKNRYTPAPETGFASNPPSEDDVVPKNIIVSEKGNAPRVKDWWQRHRDSFIKKSIDSVAMKTPEVITYLFSNYITYFILFSTSLVGILSAPGVALIYVFPFLLAIFYLVRRIVRRRIIAQK